MEVGSWGVEETYSAGNGQGEIHVEKSNCVRNWALGQRRVGCCCFGHLVNVRSCEMLCGGFGCSGLGKFEGKEMDRCFEDWPSRELSGPTPVNSSYPSLPL
jgi:hypothetical protein